MTTNQTPVEYCRHCGKREVLVCGCTSRCTKGGYIHADTGLHYCGASGTIFAEPADPPQQIKIAPSTEPLQEGASYLLDNSVINRLRKVKEGTQMEGRKPDAILNFVQDMIDRAENAHESKPGICVEIPVFMADIARIKQTLRTEVSESANREPQASPNLDLREGLLTVAEQLRERRAESERELQELRQRMLIESGAALHASTTEIASLRGLVGRMNTALVKCDSYLSLLRHRCQNQIAWGTPGLPHDTNEVDEVIGKARAISKEAEAAIKEPHNRPSSSSK